MQLFSRTIRTSVARSRGVTLLELLIVMAIMVMVTAAAIPIMIPAVQNRRMREASRLVSSYISGARSRAIETGRPVGVMVERLNGQPYAMTLSYVEVPPPYAGDTTGANCTVSVAGANVTLTLSSAIPAGLIRINDTLRLNYKPLLYTVTGPDTSPADGVVDTGTTITATFPSSATTIVPWTATSPAVAYQIFRQPVRSSAAPLQLPEGTVIDLASSGYTLTNSYPFNSGTPTAPVVLFNPVITFAPNGSVDYVTNNVSPFNLVRPIGPIFLLLGRRELMPDVSKSNVDENLYDPGVTVPALNLYLSNFWIAIGNQTGMVTVAENAFNTNQIDVARQFAQQGQGVSGQ